MKVLKQQQTTYLTEQELVQGCLRQEHKVQKEVYERFHRGMFSLCLRYVKDTAEAEDILIIGFRKVFERIHQFQAKGSFAGWIRRIMVNECLSYLEKNKNLYNEIGIDSILPASVQQKPSTELEVDELMEVINRLPNGYKAVFNLYAIEGFSHQEIAKMLDITVSTSKSQLSRARVQIQRLLAKEFAINEPMLCSA